jgi:hypothetical protein
MWRSFYVLDRTVGEGWSDGGEIVSGDVEVLVKNRLALREGITKTSPPTAEVDMSNDEIAISLIS